MNIWIPNNKMTFMATLSNLVKTLSDYVKSIIDMTFDYESMIDPRFTMEHLHLYDIPTMEHICQNYISTLSNTHMPFGN